MSMPRSRGLSVANTGVILLTTPLMASGLAMFAQLSGPFDPPRVVGCLPIWVGLVIALRSYRAVVHQDLQAARATAKACLALAMLMAAVSLMVLPVGLVVLVTGWTLRVPTKEMADFVTAVLASTLCLAIAAFLRYAFRLNDAHAEQLAARHEEHPHEAVPKWQFSLQDLLAATALAAVTLMAYRLIP